MQWSSLNSLTLAASLNSLTSLILISRLTIRSNISTNIGVIGLYITGNHLRFGSHMCSLKYDMI